MQNGSFNFHVYDLFIESLLFISLVFLFDTLVNENVKNTFRGKQGAVIYCKQTHSRPRHNLQPYIIIIVTNNEVDVLQNPLHLTK